MKQIKKYLTDNGVDFETKNEIHGEVIVITLEKGNIWVNGFGEDMLWDRKIRITQNTYKKFVIAEQTGYSRSLTHIQTGRQKDVISKLQGLSIA